MGKTRKEILFECGYTWMLFGKVHELEIEDKTNKAVKVFVRMRQNKFYMLLGNEDEKTFTIHSELGVNKYEYEYFERKLGLRYVKAGTIAQNSGLWELWRVTLK